MAKAAKPKKEITMEEALWKSADKLRGSRMRCSVSRTFYIMRLLWLHLSRVSSTSQPTI